MMLFPLFQRRWVGCLLAMSLLVGGCETTKVVNAPLDEVVTTLNALYVEPSGAPAPENAGLALRNSRAAPIGFRRLKMGPTPHWIDVQTFRDSPDQYRVIITEAEKVLKQRTVLTARRLTDQETEILASSQDNTRSFFELERDLSYEENRIADVLELLFTGDLEKTPYYQRGR